MYWYWGYSGLGHVLSAVTFAEFGRRVEVVQRKVPYDGEARSERGATLAILRFLAPGSDLGRVSSRSTVLSTTGNGILLPADW